MSEVEIIVRAKDLAKAAFESTDASVKVVRKSADELSLSLRKTELAAQSAGAAADSAMNRAAAASEKAAASAEAAAEARLKQADGEISVEEASAAEAKAERDATAATEAHTRASIAQERASIAQANAEKKTAEVGEASAAATERSTSATAAGMERLRNVGKTALAGVVAGTAAVTYEAVKMGMTWQRQMIVLVTSAGESGALVHNKLVGPIKQVSDGLTKMSGDTATSMDELAKAMYYVESAGFHAADGLKVMKAAAQGAKAENADAETVAKALTDVLVDYHLKASDAAKVTSQMITAVSHGKTSLQDFAGAFANIIPAASAAGISFEDAASALAQMTNHGFTADRASQNLAQALRSLLSPTQKMKDAFGEYGVSAAELKAKLHGPNGLTDAMQYLAEAASKAGKEGTPEFAAALKQLIGTAPGANAALTTVGANYKATADTIRAVGKATADGEGNVQGFAEVQKTLSFQLTQVKDKLEAFITQIGTRLIPVLSTALGWLSKHTTVLKVLAGIIGGVLLVAIGAYTASMAAAAAATIAATWPILAVIAVIAGLVVGFKLLYDHSKTFRDFVKKMGEDLKAAWEFAKKHWEIFVIAILGGLGVLIVYFKTHTAEMKKMWAQLWAAVQKDWKEFQKGPLKDIQHGLDDVRKFWKQNGAEITRDTKAVWRFLSMYIGSEIILAWNTVKVVVTLIVGWIKTGWGFTRDVTRLVWQFIRDFITTVVKDIHNVVVLWTDLIHGHWSKVWGDIKNLVVTNLKGALKLIGDLLKNLDTLMFDAGKNIIKMLINGIESQASALGNTLSGIANKIKGFFPFSPAKEGPLSGEGSPDKSGAKITSMLADGIASGTAAVADATTKVAAAASKSLTAESAKTHTSSSHHHRASHHKPTINQQLASLAHGEKHMSTHQLDKAVEKLMGQHKLTVAQLTKSMQILLAKGGHATSTKQIDGLIAEMKKQYVGLSSKGILDAAIKELEHHPHMSTAQLMKQVAKDLHAKARKKASSSGSGSSADGSADAGYIGDLSWTAGGVSYAVGGAGRATGPGGTAAGGTSGSTSVASGGSGGQHLTIQFATLKVEIDLKDTGGTFTAAELQGLRKMIRVRGGNVQKVLGH